MALGKRYRSTLRCAGARRTTIICCRIRTRTEQSLIAEIEVELELDRIGLLRVDAFERRALEACEAAGKVLIERRVSGAGNDRRALDPARGQHVDLEQHRALDARSVA